jgi:hypothetical protein
MSGRPILDILAQALKGLPFVDADPTPGRWGHNLNDHGCAICPSELTTQVDDTNSNDKLFILQQEKYSTAIIK